MNIEIGQTYYSPHPTEPRCIRVIDQWTDDTFKVRYSEDDWGCRLMTSKEIRESYYLEGRREPVEASGTEKFVG
jgi:hypothetical protein